MAPPTSRRELCHPPRTRARDSTPRVSFFNARAELSRRARCADGKSERKEQEADMTTISAVCITATDSQGPEGGQQPQLAITTP